jgi:hypothetical protein
MDTSLVEVPRSGQNQHVMRVRLKPRANVWIVNAIPRRLVSAMTEDCLVLTCGLWQSYNTTKVTELYWTLSGPQIQDQFRGAA